VYIFVFTWYLYVDGDSIEVLFRILQNISELDCAALLMLKAFVFGHR